MFIDSASIFVKAGKGGNGAVSFRREKFEPSGGPYGGDGGDGGSVIIESSESIRTLMDFRYKRRYIAENGEDGKTKKQYGKKGKDLLIKVPAGTLIKDGETKKVIADLKEANQRFIIAKGGKGGKGNAKFATSTRQAPRFAEAGEKGDEKNIILELKLLADVGLVGFPNVGKSTILSILSSAKPKIANYPFTTLEPNLGVVYIGEGESFVMADIPGLIEGAAEGVGLGHDFLRHIERTRLIVHVLDGSASEGRDPLNDFYKINDELFKYNEKLSDKYQIVVLNKMDIPGAMERSFSIENELKEKGFEVFKISSVTKEGIDALKYNIWNRLLKIERDYKTFDEVLEFSGEEGNKNNKDDIIVKKENEKYIVEGSFVEKLLYSTNFDDIDSLRYFQNTMRKRGIVDELKRLGIRENESVFICDHEFEFFE
ncbi:GTPase ObgE [Acidilutibacter cellobiosedens]|jgi:GTP-binding protein|uniref:GTPase Obg n=1 Tax=Acidilutibacter cellobiosedens TaxID=2507161 RepID=A0A410QDW2_9FIRM|nr:GTPase ObgE [Acidilutibacter cellobiosedens]QAT62203.1 GTPase ObgE [Acidilutibacter cellobiosedens]